MWPYTENLTWTKVLCYKLTFQICTHAKALNVQCKLTQLMAIWWWQSVWCYNGGPTRPPHSPTCQTGSEALNHPEHMLTPYWWIYWMRQRTPQPCNSTPMNLLSTKDRLHLEQEERTTARLQHERQNEQEQRQSEQTEVRQARLDRWHIQGEKSSVAFISVELNSEGSIVSTCTEYEFCRCYITHQWHNISISACSRLLPQCFYIF